MKPGSAIDELELNRVLCEHYGVRLAGVIVNKVFNDKYDRKSYAIKALLNVLICKIFPVSIVRDQNLHDQGFKTNVGR